MAGATNWKVVFSSTEVERLKIVGVWGCCYDQELVGGILSMKYPVDIQEKS